MMDKTKTLPIKPLGTLILGIQEKTASTTKSGLYIPEGAQKRTAFTEVLAVGSEVQRVAVGARVAFKEYANHEVSYDGVDYVLVEEVDVLAEVTR